MTCTCYASKKGGDIIPKESKKLEQAREQKELICELYNNGMSICQINKKTKINRAYIAIVLQEAGIKQIKSRTEINAEKHEIIKNNTNYIINEYKNGSSVDAIHDKLKSNGTIIGQTTIKKILKNNNCIIKSAKDYNTKYKKNENVFSKYNKFSCYWAGLLAADGCIYQRKDCNSRYVILALVDKETLCNFKSFIEYTGEIKKISKKINLVDKISTIWEIRCKSNKICDDLEENFNLIPHKTDIYTPPTSIPKSLIKYFILGYLDGDGCISYYVTNTGRKHFSVKVTGTHEMISYITKYFGLEHVKQFQRFPEKSVNNITLNFQGNDQIYRLLSDLYSDDDINKICMRRKYEKYLILKEQQERKKASA